MPGLFTRTSDALKAAAQAFRYGRGGGSGERAPVTSLGPLRTSDGTVLTASNWNFLVGGGGNYNLGDSGASPDGNAVVEICLGKIANVINEPALEVVELQSDGTWKAIEDHPLLDLLSAPNQIDDLSALVVAWMAAERVCGNSYLIATLARNGEPVQVDWVNPEGVRPVSNDPTVAIEYYVRRVDGHDLKYAPPGRMFDGAEGVVWHFKTGKDPQNPRLGRSRFRGMLATELGTDEEASRYSATVLRNWGVFSGILMAGGGADDPLPTPEEVKLIRAAWEARSGGENRGGLIIPTFKAEYKEAGKSPEQMALDVIRQIPQARIAAALDVPLQVAQLPAKDVSGSYANYSEAREAFWEECVIPMGTRFTDGLTRFALPLYRDTIRGPKRRRVRYNYEEVRALQPDMDKESARAVREWQADTLTLDQLLEKLHEKPVGGEVGGRYYTLHVGKMKTEVAPEPTPPLNVQVVPKPGTTPDSPGDAMASGRTPPNGVRAGLNGSGKSAATDLKSEMGAKWRERRRRFEEEEGDGE